MELSVILGMVMIVGFFLTLFVCIYRFGGWKFVFFQIGLAFAAICFLFYILIAFSLLTRTALF